MLVGIYRGIIIILSESTGAGCVLAANQKKRPHPIFCSQLAQVGSALSSGNMGIHAAFVPGNRRF